MNVSRFWLTNRDLAGRLTGVVILDSPNLPLARLPPLNAWTRARTFCQGHELNNDRAASTQAQTMSGEPSYELGSCIDL